MEDNHFVIFTFQAVKTLRLLVMNHTRKAKTLSRKAAKVTEAQASQRESTDQSSSSYPLASSSAKPNDGRLQSVNNRLSNLTVHNNQGHQDRTASTSYHVNHQSHLLDIGSQAIEESYALLNDQNEVSVLHQVYGSLKFFTYISMVSRTTLIHSTSFGLPLKLSFRSSRILWHSPVFHLMKKIIQMPWWKRATCMRRQIATQYLSISLLPGVK